MLAAAWGTAHACGLEARDGTALAIAMGLVIAAAVIAYLGGLRLLGLRGDFVWGGPATPTSR
jgi:hypothetical protein